jgi:hypothetical protein
VRPRSVARPAGVVDGEPRPVELLELLADFYGLDGLAPAAEAIRRAPHGRDLVESVIHAVDVAAFVVRVAVPVPRRVGVAVGDVDSVVELGRDVQHRRQRIAHPPETALIQPAAAPRPSAVHRRVDRGVHQPVATGKIARAAGPRALPRVRHDDDLHRVPWADGERLFALGHHRRPRDVHDARVTGAVAPRPGRPARREQTDGEQQRHDREARSGGSIRHLALSSHETLG